jgi:4-hydroxy-3-polyprenylbenzoate decarboxylase
MARRATAAPDWTAPSPWRDPTKKPPAHDLLPVVVGISGASGSMLARTTLRRLLERGERVACIPSRAAYEVWQDELQEPLEDAVRALDRTGKQLHFHSPERFNAPPASGSFRTKGMIVVPCSMTTVGGLASGAGNDLLKRSADVCIKESRRLVLVPRESPMSAIHLRNLATLAELGVRIVPPIPPFYRRPQSLEEAIEQVVDRVLQAFYD